MENFDRFPEKRVFHIDNECYIIYIGKDRQDLRPFLRVGTSDRIPKQILSDIYTVIVPNSLTGNPLYEIRNESVREYRYIGDLEIIQPFRTFLETFKTKPKAIEDYKHVKADGNRVLVYFLDNKNIHIVYDNNLIFDLKQREIEDKHFLRRADMMKEHVKRNPLQIPFHKLDRPGFILLDNITLFYNDSNIIADNLTPEYFREIAKYGIDPDLVVGAGTEGLSEGLLKFFKRKKYTDSPAVVFSSNKKPVEDFATLFPKSSKGLFDIKVHQTGAKNFKAAGLMIKSPDEESGNSDIGISHADFPGTLVLSGKAAGTKDEKSFVLNNNRGTLSGKDTVNLFRGIPYIPGKSIDDIDRVSGAYAVNAGRKLKTFMASTEISGADVFIKYFTALLSDETPDENAVSIKLEQISGTRDPAFLAYLNNVYSAALLLQDKIKDPVLKKIVGTLRDVLSKKDLGSTYIPLVGELFVHKNRMICFYRALIEGATESDVQASRKSRRYIAALPEGDSSFYFSERERLIRLSRELELPRQNMLQDRRVPEPSKSVQATRSKFNEKKPAGSVSAGTEKSGAAASIPSRPDPGASLAGRGRRSSSSGKPLLIAAAAVVLLLAGFLIWWFGFRNGRTPAGQDIAAANGDTVVQAEQSPDSGSVEGTAAGDADEAAAGVSEENGEGSPAQAAADSGNGSEQEQAGESQDETEAEQNEITDQTPGQNQDQSEGPASGSETQQSSSGTINEDPGVTEQPEADVPASIFETPRMLELRQIEFTGEDGRTYSFQITVGDIIRATNIISDLNGYRRLGTENKPGVKDSHWIYPGDILIMPEGEEYRISRGDTIWHIAAGYIQNHTVKDLEQFNTIIKKMDGRGKDEIKAALERLLENSYSSYFRRLVEQRIQSL
ncbi:MAG: LysM peptidoglycan-binding domain-containing protein [Spirochaetia bacterium]